MISIEKIVSRFLNKPIRIERTNEWECWLWQVHLNTEGYGSIYKHGQRVKVHRFSYELFIGPIPAGLVLDHLCRRRNCVNPDHLEPVTNTENILRGASKIGEYLNGRTHCDHGHALTPDNVYTGRRNWQLCKTCRRRDSQAYRDRHKTRTAAG